MKRVIKIFSLLTVVLGALALLAPPAAAGGYCRGMDLTQGTGDTVIMKGMCYEPIVLFTEPGTKVSFTNLDKAAHTVTGSGGWGTAHDEILLNKTQRFSFDKEGVYPYACLLHPGMVGAVVVGDGRDGKLAASNVGFVPPPEVGANEAAEVTVASDVEATADYGGLALVLGIVSLVLVALVSSLIVRRRRLEAEPAGPAARAIG